MGKPPALLTIEEACALLRVGRTKGYAMAKEWRDSGGASGLPVIDFGDVLRVPLVGLEQMTGAKFDEVELTPCAEAANGSQSVAGGRATNGPGEHPRPSRTTANNDAHRPRRRRAKASTDQLDLFDGSSATA